MSNETKHTPGPWKIEKYSNYYGFSIWSADRGCIAERWYDKARSEEVEIEMQANAALIASAPTLAAENAELRASHAALVEALQKMVDVGFEFYDMESGENGGPAMDQAAAALAAARKLGGAK